MSNFDRLLHKQTKLNQKYNRLIEDAYNFRVSDPSLSDFSEYQATLVLNKINKLKFIVNQGLNQLN